VEAAMGGGWRVHRALALIVLAVCLAGAQASAQDLAEADALNKQVIQLYQQSKFLEAAKIAKEALIIRETVLGPDHPDVSRSLYALATLYRELGSYSEAEPLYVRALAIAEKALDSEHRDVGTYCNGIGGMYFALGRFWDAEVFFKRALAIAERD
jgi:tetratricopeptide (TPR) repeat protein